jgi:hypothetical protein
VTETADEAAAKELLNAAQGLWARAPDPNDIDWQGRWMALRFWIVGLGNDLADAASLLAQAKAAEPERGAKELRQVLWLIDAGFEKLGGVLAHALGVPALEKLGPGVAFRPGGKAARRRLLRCLSDLRPQHPAAETLHTIAKGIGSLPSTVYRNNLAHALDNVTENPHLSPVIEVRIDAEGNVLRTDRSYLLSRRPGFAGSWTPENFYMDAISAAEGGLGKLREAVDASVVLIRDVGGCHPPERVWVTPDLHYHLTRPAARQ